MCHWRHRWTVYLLVASRLGTSTLNGQVLSLNDARTRAAQTSPELVAARAAVDAAAARARQAGAFPNPVLTYGREQTSANGLTNWQNIALFEQRFDLGGQRGARREAAELRRDAAVARLALSEAELTYKVTRAYATTVAADQRAARAREAAEVFLRAKRVTAERLAGGDVSGYANRRIGLESARYATLAAEAELARRTARLALAALLGATGDSLLTLGLQLDQSLAIAPVPPLDSLRAVAVRSHQEIRAVLAEADANVADARAARREAFPGPLAGLGFKNELAAGTTRTASGFVLQLSMPVPLWDGRRAAASAFEADAREHAASADRVRRGIARDVETAWAALHAVQEQIETIRPQLGEASRAALRAAEAAYAEGEISLVEWLDAVRAYQEAESSFATLQAEYVIQRAALERAVGARLN
jgi:cobalt-zinc-cadmium efflux system outer membrane protein